MLISPYLDHKFDIKFVSILIYLNTIPNIKLQKTHYIDLIKAHDLLSTPHT